MENSLILRNIGKLLDFNKREQDYFLSLLYERKLSRKQFLLRENEVCKFSAFVLKGCLRSYTTDKNGLEHILQFAPPDWWIADISSLISGQPGKLNIDAIENSVVLLLNRSDQEVLFDRYPKFERFFRTLTEKSLVASHNRVLNHMDYNAIQRYELFCNHYPSLIQNLSQKQIASYIGVTPEFLSKMKSVFHKKKVGRFA